MSAIAILDYGGAEAVYHHMEALAEEGRQTWIAHHGSGSGIASVASRTSTQPQSSAQVPACAHACAWLQMTAGCRIWARYLRCCIGEDVEVLQISHVYHSSLVG